jgi:small-conductance mechanosensitive channel
MSTEIYEDANRSRHWVVAGVAAGICLGLLVTLPELQDLGGARQRDATRIVVLVVAGCLGVLAVRVGTVAGFAGLQKSQAVITSRNLLAWTLYVLLAVLLVTEAGVNLSTLLFGGAVLSVVLAIVAQATLGNYFAGLLLLTVRPYRVGDSIYLRSGSFGGEQYEGTIVDIGSLYTTVSGGGQLYRIPNAVAISSVLVAAYKPVRADVRLDLPATAALDAMEERLRQHLHLQSGARVFVMPEEYRKTDGEARATVRVRIRTDEWLDAGAVVRALDQVLA